MQKRPLKIILVEPRGFCAGVKRALDVVDFVLKTYPPPVYVYHEIVHNSYILQVLRERGVIFTDDITTIPEKSVCIYSAHGVSEGLEVQASQRRLITIDATCPLVKKVHKILKEYDALGRKIVFIGHRNHPEVIGAIGRVRSDVFVVQSPEEVADLPLQSTDEIGYISQTTMSIDDTRTIVDALRKRFINSIGGAGICYATRNRQSALKNILRDVQCVFILGSKNSSNSNRLCEIVKGSGVFVHLIDTESEIELEWFDGIQTLGITAGASAPDILVERVVDFCQKTFNVLSITACKGVIENVEFALPKCI